MGKIHILDENTANKIAAGEVVERPASVVKELVENSIDAGASSVTVEIKGGGISYIRVTDNGSGMDSEDAENSFIRHATSKINDEKDLNNINTLGFRGEALASIASVAEVEMVTKLNKDTYGTRIVINGGVLEFSGNTGCPDGTTIIVKNLFYNTPARLKFLKKESREAAVISDSLFKLALSRPDISLKFINNDKIVFNTPGDGNLKNAILILYGRDFFNSLINVSYKGNILTISGYIGNSDAARSNRNFQVFFVNNRSIKNKMLSTAVDNAYKTYLPINKFAFCVLFISICPELIDVNVHPTKAEIRFQDEREVFSAIFNTVRNGLAGEVLIPDIKKDVYSERTEQQHLLRDDFDYPVLTKTIEYIEPLTANANIYKDNKTYTDGCDFQEKSAANIVVKEDTTPLASSGEIKNLLPPLVIIGQCHFTYLLAQGPDGLYIIDQHAAHERIQYEKFKNSFEKKGVESQKLLEPLVVDVTANEVCIIKDNYEVITKLGFDIDFFGNNSVILRSVPILFGEPQLKKLFLEVIDSLDSSETSTKGYIDNVLYTMACKSAVKANDRLSQNEMEELISALRKTANPYTCPHGRPTIIKLSKDELERKFKRIQ